MSILRDIEVDGLRDPADLRSDYAKGHARGPGTGLSSDPYGSPIQLLPGGARGRDGQAGTERIRFVVSTPIAPSLRSEPLPEAAHSLVVDALGTPVALSVESRSAARLQAQWSRCLTNADPVHVVDLRGHPDPDVGDYVAAWQTTLHGLLGRLKLRGRADDDGSPLTVNLHASGLADQAGAVLALVGASGSGKTTAAAVLGRHLGYVTDECVSVDLANLEVLAYPKPLSLVVDPSDPMAKTQRGPDELGLLKPPATLHLGAVVLLRRSPEPVTPSLTTLTTGEALLELLAHVSGVTQMPSPLMTLVELLERSGGAFRMEYHDVGDALSLLTEHLATRQSHPEPGSSEKRVTHYPAPAGKPNPTLTDDPNHASSGFVITDHCLVRRRWWADAVDVEEHLVVFDGERPALLAGVGRVVWQQLESRPQRLSALHRQVSAALGPHAQSWELVRDAVEALGTAGLLEVVGTVGG